MEGEAFLELLSTSQSTLLITLQSLAGYILDTGAVAVDLLFRDMRSRLASRLLAVREKGGKDQVDIRDLARWVGGTPEAVRRQAEELSKSGCIGLTGDLIKILDVEALRALTPPRAV